MAGIDYSDLATPDVTFGYDEVGRRTSMRDGSGQSSYGYDSLGRLTRHTNGAGAVVSHDYDLKGQPTSISYPGASRSVFRGYDDAGRLSSVSDWLGHTSGFGYDPNGNLSRESYPNGATATSSYDRADRLATVNHSSPAGSLLSLSYTRDNVGLSTSGPHYVTDSANSNALRARQRLALPQTPELIVGLRVPGGVFGPPTRVRPNFGMPGGGAGTTRGGTCSLPDRGSAVLLMTERSLMSRSVRLVIGDPWDLLVSDNERSLEGVVEEVLGLEEPLREAVALRLSHPIGYEDVDYDRVVFQARPDDNLLDALTNGEDVDVSVYGVPAGKALQDIDPQTWWRGGLAATATATLP